MTMEAFVHVDLDTLATAPSSHSTARPPARQPTSVARRAGRATLADKRALDRDNCVRGRLWWVNLLRQANAGGLSPPLEPTAPHGANRDGARATSS